MPRPASTWDRQRGVGDEVDGGHHTQRSEERDQPGGAGRVQAGARALAESPSERLAPQTMRLIGTTQLNRMLVGFLSIAPAITWKGTIAVKIHAHIVVRRRFVALNAGEAQNSRGTNPRTR